jgi:predicted ester cyclase
VIGEGERISARFTCNGTFRKTFMSCQPNSTRSRCEASIGRAKHGKRIEQWDEFNLLEVFQQIGAATPRKAEGQ